MKKIVSILLALVLLLTCLPALAKSYGLPYSVEKDLQRRFSGYEIGDYDYGDNFLFVNVTHNGNNTLVIYRDKGNQGNWKYFAQTRRGVPQSHNGSLKVSVKKGYYDHVTKALKYNYSTLHLYMKDDAGNVYVEAWYCHIGGSVWKLMRYFRYTHSYGVTVGDHQISYFSGSHMSHKLGTVQGNIQRDLRYVSLSNIPTSLTKAQQKFTTAPDMPYSEELQVQEGVEFHTSKQYPVYSAPWSTSVRGSKGKAAASTNDWIQVYGIENGYALIQYAVSASRYRFGYITVNALKYPEEVSALSFRNETVSVKEDCEVTDDPIISEAILSEKPLTALSEGDTVTLLAIMDTWAYIEADNYRGFIPLNAVEGYETSATSETTVPSEIAEEDDSVG